jgi:hypothetical protein
VSELLFFLAGLLIGANWSELQKLRERLEEKPKPRSGVTFGSYKKVDEILPDNTRDPNKKSGIVVPKTPQRIEWEANEQRRKTADKWGVTPPKQGL